jgi:hypothetical protein
MATSSVRAFTDPDAYHTAISDARPEGIVIDDALSGR